LVVCADDDDDDDVIICYDALRRVQMVRKAGTADLLGILLASSPVFCLFLSILPILKKGAKYCGNA
jgi:hypothetical protein